MHIPFSKIINELAGSGWGREFTDMDHGLTELTRDKAELNAYATVELIRRLNAIGDAVGEPRVHEYYNRSLEVSKSAPTFPEVAVGDFLYGGDLESGIDRYLIVAKDDQGHCMVVRADDFDLDRVPFLYIANSDHKTTVAEVIKETSEYDIAYCRKRLENAKAAIEAANNGDDLEDFMVGMECND